MVNCCCLPILDNLCYDYIFYPGLTRKPAIDILVNGSLVKNKVNLNADEAYEFNASGTLDLDGDDLIFSWDFGDGTNDTGPIVTHSYTDEQKTYQLRLTVSDGQDEAKWHVTVKINNQTGGNGQGQGS